ncbi:MAG TPA: hypothetical protein DCL95_13950 [Rhodospirillaceae bacterium]|nr:hypothetical protein [Rhodospirillaceae bacterium]MAX62828.1 hypothetical protein [Rhodospirillaceae bacterium]MBB57673.1 hypothetical protein [Rhodospirillaceae bacterium]HAJ21134.1 hypothetical protein [Rhodospirillaceae bacterium]HBM13270.1 hypothetical protein [Rhodospirillaceae bacterium]
MILPDDSTLNAVQYNKIRQEAERALRDSGAIDVLPTPTEAIMRVAKISEVREDVLDTSAITDYRKHAGGFGDVLRRAISKVLGLIHAPSGLICLDKSLIEVKKRFVGFHEAAHGFLPWQRAMYSYVEDGEQELDPESAELFDKEANVFAAEILFQLDTFVNMSNDANFGLKTPINLARKFNASLYASIRQYVSKNHRSCAVLVLYMPERISGGQGYSAKLRRRVQSPSFTELFGACLNTEQFTSTGPIGSAIPLGRKRFTSPQTIVLKDINGEDHECMIEGFTNTHQVFILFHDLGVFSRRSVSGSQWG